MSFLSSTNPTQSLEETYAPKEETEFTADQPSISHMIPLIDLCNHFPDLPSFIHHRDFDHFAYCWMEFQYNIIMSQHVACRPRVDEWLVSMSAQLGSIVARYTFAATEEEDPEASTVSMKYAYQRLIHRFGVVRKLLDRIERGCVAGQSPQEVVLPIYNQVLQYTLDQRQKEPFIPNANDMPSLSMLSLSSPIPRAPSSTSSFRSLACMEVMPYLNESCVSSPHVHPLSLVLPSTDLPVSWSTPVTPNVAENTRLFWSCPVSPSYTPPVLSTVTSSSSSLLNQEEPLTPLELTDASKTPENGDELSSEYQQSQEDEEEPEETTPKKTDTTTSTRRRQRRIAQQKSTKARTATSYDNATTHYLMSMFFTVYSERDKLTKEQRQQVVQHTGLNPRNVTYWFSNHKRRFQSALFLFKRLVAEGRIQSYQDFIDWRREQGMSDDMVETCDF